MRRGAYIAPGVVLMPSFVNLGAYVDEGTMVDTWATVGSCAQIGKNVHLSGGVGIGGVLEPLQASPTIIEDNCFIGARSEVVEGVVVGEGSVLSMGVFIGASTKIIDRATGEIFVGRVPPYSVVVSGIAARQAAARRPPGPSLYCAVIVKRWTRRPEPRPRSTSFCGTRWMDTYAARSRPITAPLPFGHAGGGRRARVHCELCWTKRVSRSIVRCFPRPARPTWRISMPGSARAATCCSPATPTSCLSATTTMDARPFAASIDGGELYGRGAVDMKGGIACFDGGGAALHSRTRRDFEGSIGVPDHRRRGRAGDQRHGQAARLGEGRAASAGITASSASRPIPTALGDMIKIGRRGSLAGDITVDGKQGHVAYPHLADNPVPGLMRLLDALLREPLDAGTEHFEPRIWRSPPFDVGNPAANVIAGEARATLQHPLQRQLDAGEPGGRDRQAPTGQQPATTFAIAATFEPTNALAFLTPPNAFVDFVSDAIEAETGIRPKLSTTGGTSDARFIVNELSRRGIRPRGPDDAPGG